MTENQISFFTPLQIQIFTPEQILFFTKEQISWFTTDQIQVFTPEQIPYFTKEQIQSLTMEQIQSLIAQQIQSFTKDQIPFFTDMQIQWFRTDQRKFFKVIRIPIINKLKTSSLIIKENQIFVEEKIGKKSSQWSLKKFWFLVISFFFTTTSIFSLFYIFKKNKNQLTKKSKLKKEDNFNEGGCQSYEIINYHISNLFPKLPFKNDDRQIKFSFTLKFIFDVF
ncbi:hypothetical protein [Spiroplasma endosymbiont of Tricholauxania praeusta]|uniref:hypothetical protein n=1 Tax=Spiroplasma endosymbiont of Tricholauxania praeusta TaxID=3066296 RepID=UPI0030D21322